MKVVDERQRPVPQGNQPAIERTIGMPTWRQDRVVVAVADQLAIVQLGVLFGSTEVHSTSPGGRYGRQRLGQIGMLPGPSIVALHPVEVPANQPARDRSVDHGNTTIRAIAEPLLHLRLGWAFGLVRLPFEPAGRLLRPRANRDDRPFPPMVLQGVLQDRGGLYSLAVPCIIHLMQPVVGRRGDRHDALLDWSREHHPKGVQTRTQTRFIGPAVPDLRPI